MKLISLDIHLNQVNALAGFDVVVERDHFYGNGAAGIPISLVRPMIDV
jgi:hypothetical protein